MGVALMSKLPPHVERTLDSILRAEAGVTLDSFLDQFRQRDPGRLLKVDEVAKRWSCSKPTVWRRIKTGQLKTVRIGGMTRIPESELLAVVEGGGRHV